MNPFVINLSQFPVVAVVYPERPTIPDVAELFEVYADLAKAGARVGYTIDMRRFDPAVADAKTRAQAVAIFKKHEVALKASTICEARIVPGSVTREVLTAFDWMTGDKWPCANMSNAADAVAWVHERLIAAGVPTLAVPPRLVRFELTADGVLRFPS